MRFIKMLKLDEAMEKGIIERWLKREGERVAEGEPIVEIVSEKVTYEITAPTSGVLYKILSEKGAEVPVGGVIGVIMEEGDDVSDVERAIAEQAAKRPVAEAVVERAAPAKAEALAVEELRGVREVVVGWEAPHATLMVDVDVRDAENLRKALEDEYGGKVLFDSLLVKAVAKALREHPALNAMLEGDVIKLHKSVNIAVAVPLEGEVSLPVVKDADSKTLKEINDDLIRLVEGARSGSLPEEEFRGATFTVVDLGVLGVDSFVAVIRPGQAAILTMGRISEKPTVYEGKIAIRPVATLSLSFDHRIVDGAPAAQFLATVKRFLENPYFLL